MSQREPFWKKMSQHHSHLLHRFISQRPSWEHLFNVPRVHQGHEDFRFRQKAAEQVWNAPNSPRYREWMDREPSHLSGRSKATGSHLQRTVLQSNQQNQTQRQPPRYSKKRLDDLAMPKGHGLPARKNQKIFADIARDSFLRTGQNSSGKLQRSKGAGGQDLRDPYQVSWGALNYTATPRISKLAEPSRKVNTEYLVPTWFKPLGKAPTQRLEELAKPKLRRDTCTRTMPYQVASRALKAKITPRLVELAKPRM